jgi:aerotaxis receptor
MHEAEVVLPCEKMQLTYQDGTERQVLFNEEEVPFPEGRLIVSRTDLKGLITHCNQSFVDMSGYSEDELIGEPHHILRHPDMPAAAFGDLWQTIEGGKKWHGYVKNLRKDGRYYWVYATVIPNIRHEEIVGYTSVRRKPSRSRVEECVALYAEMKQAEVKDAL